MLFANVSSMATLVRLAIVGDIVATLYFFVHFVQLPFWETYSWFYPVFWYLLRFHDLRHSAATLLLSMGVPAKVVQEILGHSTFGTTMNRYSHVLPTMQQEAMDKMDSFFRQQF